MPDNLYLLAAVLISAAVTWGLRAVPFALLAPLRTSRLISFLGDQMPVGVMISLVGYTLRDVVWPDPSVSLPVLAALIVTAALQFWKSHLVLSLAGGTGLYVITATAISLHAH